MADTDNRKVCDCLRTMRVIRNRINAEISGKTRTEIAQQAARVLPPKSSETKLYEKD